MTTTDAALSRSAPVHVGRASRSARPHDPRREGRPAGRRLGVRGGRRARAWISTRLGALAGRRHRPDHPPRRVHQPAPVEVARAANAIQRFLVEETRLGIPAIIHEECLHGLLALEAPCFQQSIGAARDLRPRPGRPGGGYDPASDAGDRGAPCPGAGPRHRARPALGPDRGDLRRGSVPRGGARRGLHPGPPGPRPPRRRAGHRQAPRRPRPGRGWPQSGPGAPRSARDAGRAVLPVRDGRASRPAWRASCRPTATWTGSPATPRTSCSRRSCASAGGSTASSPPTTPASRCSRPPTS